MATCRDSTGLWVQYGRTRSTAARNTLVEYYMPLVRNRASLLIGRMPDCISEDDLCSAGYDGLIQAVEAFDVRRKVVFEAFCQKRILGAMCDWLRQVSPHSRSVQAFLTRSNRVRNTLSTAYGRRPTDEEVADQMGMPQPRFNYLSRIARNEEEIQLSVLQRRTDVGFNGDSGEASWELADPKPIDPSSKTTTELLLESITSGLSRDERLILTLYYYEELTLKEIGAVLDISESRVSQMHTAVLERLWTRLSRDPEYPSPGDRRAPDDKKPHARYRSVVPAEAAA